MTFPDTPLGRAADRLCNGATPLERAYGERDFYEALAGLHHGREMTPQRVDRLERLEDLAWDAERHAAAIIRDEARVRRDAGGR